MTVVENGMAAFSFALWVASHLAAVIALHQPDWSSGANGRVAKEPDLPRGPAPAAAAA